MTAADRAAPYEVDPSRALPTVAYRDPEVHQSELERIWHADWVFVGTADEVAEPGDHVAVDVGGQPVLLLRDQDGELAALSNLCAHRGTLLVEGAGNAKRFQCPYHAWTFADDGSLLSVPHAAAADVDKAAACLPRYRAEAWHGLVFVSLDHDVASLADRFSHLDDIATGAGMGALHHWTSARGDHRWHANWKLVITNAMESYHLFKVHPETLEPYTPTAGSYYVAGSADGTATGGASTTGADYTLLSLPPNFVGVLTEDSLLWQAVQPLAVDRTRIVTGAAYHHPPAEASRGLSRWVTKASTAVGTGLPDFLPEDRAICERGQRGATGGFTPGPLLPVEQVIVDFHHFLNRQLHGVPGPPVRTSTEVGLSKKD